MRRIIIGLTGSTGAIFGVRMLEALKATDVESHLIISKWAQRTLEHETRYTVEQVRGLANVVHSPGDMGASMLPAGQATLTVTDFEAHLPTMRSFHRRYMVSNRVCRYWVDMVRKLDPEWIVPQHGAPLHGKVLIKQFLDWIEDLMCGVDLMTQEAYRLPTRVTFEAQ